MPRGGDHSTWGLQHDVGYGWDMGWMWLIGPLTLVVIVLIVLLAVRLYGGGIGGQCAGSLR